LSLDLELLWSLTGVKRSGEDSDWNAFFDPIGLILRLPPEYGGYWCTPTNSVSFATTGGDGTHFSILRIAGRQDDRCPVVMTVPMSDAPNVIVGEDLRDFLALGCRRGYFSLFQFVHSPEEAFEQYASAAYDPEATSDEIEKLRLIETTFQLRPWRDIRRRIAKLRLRYHSLLEMPPPDEAD
jgi:hypothetical protein